MWSTCVSARIFTLFTLTCQVTGTFGTDGALWMIVGSSAHKIWQARICWMIVYNSAVRICTTWRWDTWICTFSNLTGLLQKQRGSYPYATCIVLRDSCKRFLKQSENMLTNLCSTEGRCILHHSFPHEAHRTNETSISSHCVLPSALNDVQCKNWLVFCYCINFSIFNGTY